MIKTKTLTRLFDSAALLVVITSIVLVQGCSSGGGSAQADSDPNGFYDAGSASVKLSSDNVTDLSISDLQGMVSGNRFMLMSEAETILYDGTITGITGTTFTGTVNIYEDGDLLPGTTTVAGTINSASSITGTFTGVGPGNGTFSLTYSLNNAASDIARIDTSWIGNVNGVANSVRHLISNAGDITHDTNYSPSTPVVAGCTISTSSTATPVSDVNVYTISVTLSACTNNTVDGTYTGLATTLTVIDDELILLYSNDLFSVIGILPEET